MAEPCTQGAGRFAARSCAARAAAEAPAESDAAAPLLARRKLRPEALRLPEVRPLRAVAPAQDGLVEEPGPTLALTDLLGCLCREAALRPPASVVPGARKALRLA